jgi:hypothetical protein
MHILHISAEPFHTCFHLEELWRVLIFNPPPIKEEPAQCAYPNNKHKQFTQNFLHFIVEFKKGEKLYSLKLLFNYSEKWEHSVRYTVHQEIRLHELPKNLIAKTRFVPSLQNT